MNAHTTEDRRPLLTEWARVVDTWERSLRRPYTDAMVRETGYWCLVRIDADGRHVICEDIEASVDHAKAKATAALRRMAEGGET